jgi:predicted transcriptional regulator of viral defense system
MHYLLYLQLLKMMNMKGYEQYGMIPVDYGTILTNLSDYKSPKDKVSKLEKSGDLIRLKKGLYLISPTLSKQTLSIELIANHLYGPSYISYESALSFYGLIPERVYSVKSATSKRSKKYLTPIGNYEYITVPEHYFSIGLNQKIIQDSFAFIIASPEKAICDLVLSTPGLRLQSQKAMNEYLIDDLRVDFESVNAINPEIIKECVQFGYKKKELELLYQVLLNINQV